MDEYAQRRLTENDLGKSFFCQERGRRRAGRGRRRIEEEEEEEIKKEPEVPPTTKVSSSTQTDLPGEAPQSESSRQGEVPASTASSRQREEAKEEKRINDDDTAPPVKKPATLLWYGLDITGNEEDSILRGLSNCFSDGYHSIWAGFYNLGFPRPKQQTYALAQEVSTD